MTGSKFLLLDTNILIYAHDELSPKNKSAKDLVEKALNGEIEASISHQNLLEFAAAITQPKKVSWVLSIDKALEDMDQYLASNIKIIVPNQGTILIAKDFLKSLKLKGRKVFDVYLAATMLSNGINVIYTDNDKDFEIFKEIRAINPFK